MSRRENYSERLTMAFLREYIHRCDYGDCSTKASLELLTFRNELFGRYCRRHARQMLTIVSRDEQRYFDKQHIS
jgi:hypothetical protein